MTPLAIFCLALALTIIWGGLIASTVYLMRRPEVSEYPAGGQDAAGERLE